MNMTKVKICGLKTISDINAVNLISPNYIGFVFAESKRQINKQTAKLLKSYLSPNIKPVGVFVNEPIKYVIEFCNENIIDIVQLHGDETENYINQLKQYINNPIIKAIRVKEDCNLMLDQIIQSKLCDYYLFDSYHPKQYGGVGKTFKWSLIENIEKPFFLAGGINITNVKTAIQSVNPYCIDVSSSVETNGIKDFYKMKQLVQLVKNINLGV